MCQLILNILKAFKANKQAEKQDNTYTDTPQDNTYITLPDEPVTPVPPEEYLTIPYPEELFDPTQTPDTDLRAMAMATSIKYGVPEEYRAFWMGQVEIAFSDELNNPAWYWLDAYRIMHLRFNVGWANPGTISYERAHGSWDLNTDEQKTAYHEEFNRLKNTDPLLIKLFKEHPWELQADTDTTGDYRIAGHAEIYRCLGQFMPESLKMYYPRLF